MPFTEISDSQSSQHAGVVRRSGGERSRPGRPSERGPPSCRTGRGGRESQTSGNAKTTQDEIHHSWIGLVDAPRTNSSGGSRSNRPNVLLEQTPSEW